MSCTYNRDLAEAYCKQLTVRPIGFMESQMPTKASAPHQGSVCPLTKATLSIDGTTTGYTNPHHALHGLEQYSHVWLLFIFHLNGSYRKTKVRPPRLDGQHRVGVLSCRTPHRLNPIGLTLAKLDRITGNTLHMSGVDLVDGTAVIDIKPYIPQYDSPLQISEPVAKLECYSRKGDPPSSQHITQTASYPSHSSDCGIHSDAAELEAFASESEPGTNELGVVINDSKLEIHDSDLITYELQPTLLVPQEAHENTTSSNASSAVRTPRWVVDGAHGGRLLRVSVTPRAECDLTRIGVTEETRCTLVTLLSHDPRSVYRRHRCRDRLFYHVVDHLHLTCWCDDDEGIIEVLKVKPAAQTEHK